MKKDLMGGYVQHPPYFVEIDVTEGCNLGCSFCGLRGIREKGTKPWYFMTAEIAEEIARKIKEAGWKSAICFCGHGEPSLNPDLLKIFKIFRKHLPQTPFQLVTNGYGFRHGIFEINSFFDVLEEIGFNDVVFDVYSENGDWKVVDKISNRYDIKIVGHDGEGYNHRKKKMRVALYPLEVDKNKAMYRNMDNHCGAAAPQDYSDEVVNRRCEKPFRSLFIRYDGGVALCCDDFRGQFKIGNISDFDDFNKLWNDPKFQAVRIMLFSGRRKLKPCYGCTHTPLRAGLLPDPCGKDKKVMEGRKLTPEIEKIIKSCYDEKGSTTIVKRKWEK